MTAETDAVGRALLLLDEATVNEPPEYWQALLDDLEPFVDLETVNNLNIACRYLVALRDKTDRAHTAQGRAAYLEDATFFLEQALRFQR